MCLGDASPHSSPVNSSIFYLINGTMLNLYHTFKGEKIPWLNQCISPNMGSVLIYKLLGTPPHPPSKNCNRILVYISFKIYRCSNRNNHIKGRVTIGKKKIMLTTFNRSCDILLSSETVLRRYNRKL